MKKVRYPDSVSLRFGRDEAEKLRSALEAGVNKFPALSVEAVALKHLSNEIFDELAPHYAYEVKCSDCGKSYDIETKRPLDDKAVKAFQSGRVCSSCMDDYK